MPYKRIGEGVVTLLVWGPIIVGAVTFGLGLGAGYLMWGTP